MSSWTLIFLIVNIYVSFTEIKNLIRNYLALIKNKYSKIKGPFLPDLKTFRLAGV